MYKHRYIYIDKCRSRTEYSSLKIHAHARARTFTPCATHASTQHLALSSVRERLNPKPYSPQLLNPKPLNS